MCRFSLFIISMVNFSMLNSSSRSWLYILIACICVSNSFSFLAKSLISFMYITWFIFSCDLLSLYQPMHFLCGCVISSLLQIVMVIVHLPGIYLFRSSLQPRFSLLVSIVFSIKFMTSCDILYILRQYIIQLCGTKLYAVLLSIHAIARFFHFVLLPLRMSHQCIAALIYLWPTWGIL